MHYFSKTLILFSFLLAPSLSQAQNDSVFVDSKVTDVNVFFAGAQVTRTAASTPLSKGRHVLIFENLPIEVLPQTVNAKSLENATIHSVVFEKFRDYKKTQKEKGLDKSIQKEQKKLKALTATLHNLKREEQLILSNNSLRGTNGVSVSEIEKAASFYRERLGNISVLKISLSTEYDSIVLHIQDLAKQVNKYTSQRYFPKGRITMVVEVKTESLQDVSVSYYVPSARWESTYDFKVQDLNSPLEIVNRAKVYQSTGEDWEGVNLTLSTGTPQQKVEKPQLYPWDILSPPRYPRTQSSIQPPASFSMTLLDQDANPLGEAIVTVKQNGKLLFYQMTDNKGQIRINPIPYGYYNLEIESYGFEKKTHNLRLNPRDHKNLTVTLVNQFKKIKGLELSADPVVEIRGSRSNTSAITMEEIQKMPVRNLNKIAGVSSRATLDEVAVVAGKRDAEIESYNLNMEISDMTNRLSFELKDSYSIPSNGKDNFVEMYTQSVPVNYVHYVVPKIETEVYLTASIPEASKLGLSEGTVNVYFEGVYTGRSHLDPKTISDTLIFSLGQDKNVTAERQLSKKEAETSSFGNQKRVNIGYTYKIRNSRKETISIVVQDQIPLSSVEKITVELLESTGAHYEAITGFLDWELDLKSNTSVELKSEFQVKMPSKTQLSIE